MQANVQQSSNVFLRDDTFFGVCEALGEDFGFNPLWLRLAFAVGLLWNPVAVLGAYLAVGLLVAFSRLVVRNPRRAAPLKTVAGRTEPAPAAAREEAPELAVAA